MRAWYYDPSLWRFASEDPGRHGMNWLLYCNDNPISNVDRDGKTYYPVATDISFAVGALLTSAAIAAFYIGNFVASALIAGVALAIIGVCFWAEDINQQQAYVPLMQSIAPALYALADFLVAGTGTACRNAGVAAVAVIACCVEGMELVGGLATQDADAAK